MARSHDFTSEDQLNLLLQSTRDYCIFFMLPNGDICRWSKGAEKMVGYGEEEALSLSGDVIFTPADLARGAPEEERATALKEGEANDERWHVRKDGSLFFAIGRLVALKEPDGKLRGYAKILRDATPQKKLEESLRATEEQLRAIFVQAPWGIVVADLELRIRQVNQALAKMVRVPENELIGRELISLSYPEDREKTLQHVERLFREKKDTVSFQKRMVRADGSFTWVENSITILRDAEGRPSGLLDLTHDISPLKISEEELARRVEERTTALREKTEQMEAFCYTVAHDLRAPLRAIAGYAELLRGDLAQCMAETDAGYIQKIQTSAARMDQLIRDLLGYTRVQQVSMAQDEVDLTAVVNNAIAHAASDAQAAQAQIDVEAPLGHVRSDAVALEHIFANLISNAVKFRRPEATVRVRIYAEQRGDRIRVWVEDNGIGMNPKYKDRAFQMFERLHPHLNIQGTGVGLAIVSTAIERLGGSRGVEPNVPHGSRFWVELPR
jgi:PAS domain S-box-containing protein